MFVRRFPLARYIFAIMGATCGTAVMFLFPALIKFYLPRYQRRQPGPFRDSEIDESGGADDNSGSLVDVASGRQATLPRSRGRSGSGGARQSKKLVGGGGGGGGAGEKGHDSASAERGENCVRWLFFLSFMTMGVFVVITGTYSAVLDLIQNLIDK